MTETSLYQIIFKDTSMEIHLNYVKDTFVENFHLIYYDIVYI